VTQDLVHELYATAEEEGILPPKEPSRSGSVTGPAGTSPSKDASASPSVNTGAGAASSTAGGGRSVTPASPAPGVLTLAMLPKKRGRPTKEEAAARAAAGYVKKPPRVKNKPAPSEHESPAVAAGSGRATPSLGGATSASAAAPPPQQQQPTVTAAAPPPAAAMAAAAVVPSKPIDVSIPWETYIPPSPSKMSEPNLSDQEEPSANYYAATAALDERLARAEGFEVDAGWWTTDGGEAAYEAVLDKLKGFVDGSGRRLAETLEEVPMPTDNKLLSFQVRPLRGRPSFRTGAYNLAPVCPSRGRARSRSS